MTEETTPSATEPIDGTTLPGEPAPSEGEARVRRDTVPTESVLGAHEILPPPPAVPSDAAPSRPGAGGPPRPSPMSAPPPLPPRPTQSLRRGPLIRSGVPGPTSPRDAGAGSSSQPPARLGRTMPPPAATPLGTVPRPVPPSYRPPLPPDPGAVRSATTQRLGTQPGVATPVGTHTPHGRGALPQSRPPSFPPPPRGSVPPTDVHEHLAQLASRTHAARDAIARHDGDIRSLRTHVGLLDARVTEMEEGTGISSGAPPSAELAGRIADLERVIGGLQEDVARQAEALGVAATRIAELTEALANRPVTEPRARAASSPAEPDSGPRRDGDDLRAIKGIGPKFEDALRAVGVTRYAQIAAWTEADVARIADVLGIKAQRIERAGWVEAARRLAAG